VAEDTTLVVDHVAVAASDPLGLLDDPVEPLSAGIVDIFEKSGQDCRPPGLDRAGEPSRFGQLGVDGSLVKSASRSMSDATSLSFGLEHELAFLRFDASMRRP
jgi:hypothetical protein